MDWYFEELPKHPMQYTEDSESLPYFTPTSIVVFFNCVFRGSLSIQRIVTYADALVKHGICSKEWLVGDFARRYALFALTKNGACVFTFARAMQQRLPLLKRLFWSDVLSRLLVNREMLAQPPAKRLKQAP
jgi:hypothetical protein